MSDDLRSQRSASVEGKGRARRAWDAYVDAADRLRPKWVEKALNPLALKWTEEMLGFWLAWHMFGGFEGLKRAGWSERTIYRRLKRFRLVFEEHPDSFDLAGVELDREVFWNANLPGAEG